MHRPSTCSACRRRLWDLSAAQRSICKAPPTSDCKTRFCPAGLTNNTAMSSGQVCVKPLSVTVRLLIVPDRPETVMIEGKGLPVPGPPASASLITMAALFEKLAVTQNNIEKSMFFVSHIEIRKEYKLRPRGNRTWYVLGALDGTESLL